MAGTIWGTETQSDFLVTGDPLDQVGPSVADSGGGSYGVAWTSAAGVTVRFYDVVGQVDPALGTITLTANANATGVSLTAGGAVGYAAAWEESGVLMGRYVGLSGPVGAAFAISGAAGFTQHDAATSGYAVDGPNGKPVVDGFNVVWVQTSAAELTPAEVAAGYGRIMLQRFAVPLDARVDPLGPPVAAGLDGVVGGSEAAVNVGNEAGAGALVIGRDPNTIVTHDGDTIVTWVDRTNNVHVRAYDLTGNVLDGGIVGANLANLGTVNGNTEAKIADLAGSGFVVAWVVDQGAAGKAIMAQIFAPGVALGTYTAGAVLQLQAGLPAAFNGDFALGTLIDTGGFSLSWANAAGDLSIVNFNSGGGGDGLVTTLNTTTAGNQGSVALAGLIGDRVVAVFQDDSAGSQDIRTSIIDTRVAGQVLVGDVGGNGAPKAIADQLVGTVGNDTLSGLANDDQLYGAIGNDLLTGGSGNDIVDGGAGQDIALFSGNQADYTIDYLGANVFSVVDNRGGTPDGADTLINVETLRFADGDVSAAFLIGGIVPVTPTAWGWTNADADNAPDLNGSPDTDGFIVNHTAVAKLGIQGNVTVADSVGEFLAIAWESTSGTDPNSHIFGQFYDVIGAPDSFIPNRLALSDGIGIETNVAIASGGANSGWAFAFEERDNASDTTRALKTNFVGPGQLTSSELLVENNPNVDQHDAAVFGSFLDRTLGNPVGGSALPTGMNEGYNVVWVASATSGAAYGEVRMQRFEVPLDALGNPGAPVAGGRDGIAGLDGHTVSSANDGAFQIAASGRNPGTSSLHTNETGIIWIQQDGAGGEDVMFRALDDIGQDIGTVQNISGAFKVVAGTNAQIASAGAVNFGISWITQDVAGNYHVMATMLSSAGTGLDGAGFGFGAPAAPFDLFTLPAGFVPGTSDFQITGISGEDSNDLVVSWKMTTGTGSDIYASHIKVALDPVTGIAIAMTQDGGIITVNAETSGNQTSGNVAGLLGDRFVTVWQDDNAGYTDGADIVARIIDTRDAVNPDPITGDLIRAGVAQARRDVLIGTNGNDVIRGDISDTNGLVDYIYAGMGDDVVQGGPGLRGAAGIPEIIDGGEGSDIAVFTGRRQDYSITINGDGSIEVIDLRPTQDGAGNPLQHDGIDNLYSIETLRFLNLTQADPNPAVPPAPTDVVIDLPGTPPAPPVGYDGTPVAWSLSDTSTYKEIAVDAAPNTVESGIAVTNLQDGAGLAWVKGGNEVWAITFDTTGNPDPILLGANTQLTDGAFAGNAVSNIDVAMTGGLGMTAAWQSTYAGDSSVHIRFASTNTHIVLDPAGGVPGPGLPGGEQVVVGSDGAGSALKPVVQGYEIVDVNNDTLEVGFHVGFVMDLDGDGVGSLMLARYEIPVYDILVDGNGLPILDGGGQGQLATDLNGNLVPSTTATFGTGSETAPISIGLDGLRGTADDAAAIVLTDQGLFAANNVPLGATVLQGRDMTIGSLHDGQLVVSYIDAAGNVQLHVYVPTVDEANDREQTVGIGGSDIFAQGITTYSELTLPANMTAGLGTVAAGQTAMIVPQQNGSFGVFWGQTNGANTDVMGIVYSGAGTNWSPSPVINFGTLPSATAHFQVAITGVTPGGLEDGFFVSWETATGIVGQRFDMTGATVGTQIVVGDPLSGTPGLHSTTGIDDGRMLIGYQDGGDVSAQFLDNREPGIALIGPRTGAPADVIVGTVGDDAIDGRALNDQLFGGLGNDLITMGSGADIGFGGAGNDTIVGATGQDQLLGEDGDDLLWGGLSGPADPQADRDLVTGLTAAGVAAALIATNPGADMVSGGNGTDTISFQSEFGRFNINLSTGIVTSDRGETGNFILEDVIGSIGPDGAGGTIFTFSNDIENATGGIGHDTLIGTAGNNVLDGGTGNNVLDGLGGNDTAIIHGAFAEYTIAFNSVTNTFTFTDAEHTDIVSNVETFVFEDVTKTRAELIPGPVANADTATVAEDGAVTIDVLANDADAGGANITAINGTAIVMNQTVATLNGSVRLTSSGTGAQLLVFTPSANYFGPASFDYTVTNASGRNSTASVAVTVTNTNDAPTDIVFNGNAATNSATVLENSASGTLIASLATTDPDNVNGVVNDTFTYTLADSFGGRFQIVGNEIRVLNSALFNFETGPNSFVLSVTSNDGHVGSSITETITVNVADVNEAPTNIRLGGLTTGSFSEAAANGTFIGGLLSGTDPEGGALRFALSDDAGGRFKIVKDAAGYHLAVAENLLIDHAASDANHGYSVTVEAKDAAGNASTQILSLTATGVAENRVAGGNANANTLTGTAGNDYIDGGANKDTMTGLGGNDVYVVDNSGDKVIEQSGQGNDTIYTTLASYDLGSAANVENVVYTGSGNFNGKLGSNLAGTAIGNVGNDQLSGGGQADRLVGLGGNDTLSGGGGNDTLVGGAGADNLTGGAGSDTFVFAKGFGNDVITDFGATAGAGQDFIDVDTGFFNPSSATPLINQLLANAVQVGQNVVITLSPTDTITVQKVTLASLDVNDFHFV